MKKDNLVYRQGDVGISYFGKVLPAGAEEVKSGQEGKVILAYGEVTGHHHRFETANVTAYKFGDQEFIKVDAPSNLIHEEHDQVTFETGVYEIIHQREYQPEAIRRVID